MELLWQWLEWISHPWKSKCQQISDIWLISAFQEYYFLGGTGFTLCERNMDKLSVTQLHQDKLCKSNISGGSQGCLTFSANAFRRIQILQQKIQFLILRSLHLDALFPPPQEVIFNVVLHNPDLRLTLSPDRKCKYIIICQKKLEYLNTINRNLMLRLIGACHWLTKSANI